MFYRMILVAMLMASAQAGAQAGRSVESIASVGDIYAYAESRLDEILQEEDLEKKKEKFKGFYAEIKRQVDFYNEVLNILYGDIGNTRLDKKDTDEDFQRTAEELASKQKLMDHWAGLYVDYQKPAELFVDDNPEMDCDTIVGQIVEENFMTAPEDTTISQSLRRVIEITRSLCGHEVNAPIVIE